MTRIDKCLSYEEHQIYQASLVQREVARLAVTEGL